MKAGSIPSSQLAKYGRWDAGFHLAVQSVEARVAELEAKYTAEDLKARLQQLPAYAFAPLEPLIQSWHRLTYETAQMAIEKYPFVAFALVERDLEGAKEYARKRVSEAEAELNKLVGF